MKNYLAILLCSLLLCSCSRDDENKDEFYFEATLNSEEWNKTNANPEIVFNEEEDLFVLRSKKNIDEQTDAHVLILFDEPSQIKDYNMSLQHINGGDILLSLYSAESNNEENSLTIVEFNKEENILTGEFQSQLLHSGGELWNDNEFYQMQGKFRLRIQN